MLQAVILRADYWKSQPRKFCEMCKCWIADNKASINFHESGKKHKGNVAKKISDLCKRSTKQAKANEKLDAQMRRMEEEALKAYRKDIEANPDFSSLALRDKVVERERELEYFAACLETERKSVKIDKSKDKKKSKSSTYVNHTTEEASTSNEEDPSKLWYEAKTEYDQSYYWHTLTNQTTWDEPSEGFVTMKQQEYEQKEFEEGEQKIEENCEELKALAVREANKRKYQDRINAIATIGEEKEEEPEPIDISTRKHDPYGAWTIVSHSSRQIDLQLPKQEYVAIKLPKISEPKIRIREKAAAGINQDTVMPGETISFKKRKVVKGNMRQRTIETDE